MEGWICSRCGNSNSPQLLVCGCSSTTAANSSNTAASIAATVVQERASKPLASKTSSKARTYTQYNDEAFLSFWSSFPLKRGKAAAFARWKKVVAAGVSPQQLIEAAAAYRDDPTRDIAFTKWPEGWLNDGRWEDEPAEVSHPVAAVPDIDFEADQRRRWAEQGWSEEDEANFAKNAGGAAMALLNGDGE